LTITGWSNYYRQATGAWKEFNALDRWVWFKDYIVYLGYKIGETTVRNILVASGFDPEPDMTRKTTWKQFIQSP